MDNQNNDMLMISYVIPMYFEEKFEYEPKRPEKGCRCHGKERKEEKMCFESAPDFKEYPWSLFGGK